MNILKKKLNGDKGFTLIELMVTVAIMSLIFYIMASTLYKEDSRKNEVYNAARDLGMYIQQYRMKTINENICYLFNFTSDLSNIATDKYDIYEHADCNGTISGTPVKTVNLSDYKYNIMFGGKDSAGYSHADGVSIGTSSKFYIKPRGFLNTGVTKPHIYFTNLSDYNSSVTANQAKVKVDPLTGRVDIEKFITDSTSWDFAP